MPFKKTPNGYVWVPNGNLHITTPRSPSTGMNINDRLQSINNARKGVSDLRKKQEERNKAHRDKHGG